MQSILSFLLLILFVVVFSETSAAIQSVCVLRGANTAIANGTIVIQQTETSTSAQIHIGNVNPTTRYIVSVHEYGDVRGGDGTYVGKQLGNSIEVNSTSNGVIDEDFMVVTWNLSSTESIVGKSLVLSNSDNQIISQCVVGVQNTQSNTATSLGSSNFAVCEVYGSVFGRATFERSGNQVRVRAKFCGLSNGYHGIHVHEFGDLTGSIDTVGSHFDKSNSAHDLPTNPVRHFGDLGNIQSNSGEAIFDVEFNLLALEGTNSIIGRALVLHSGKDQGAEFQPAGESGTKIARCVIGAGSDTLVPLTDITCPTISSVQQAICQLKPTSLTTANIQGTITLAVSSDVSSISGTVTGLSSNTVHGFHIQEYGDLSLKNGSSTGGHFNPTSAPHSDKMANTTRHIGDLGNIFADDAGHAIVHIDNLLWTLQGSKSVIGRALVVREKVDQGTQPDGNAGSIIAQCVIGVQSVDNNVARADTPGTSFAVAEIVGITNSTIKGRVTFESSSDKKSVTVRVKICGLTAGNHGFHIHSFGDTRTADTVGAHYDPNQSPHRLPDNAALNRHVGDLGNIHVEANGTVEYSAVFPFSLEGEQSVIGRAIVIHSDSDKGVSKQPAGDGGTKIAFGVIGVTNKLVSLPVGLCTDPTPNDSKNIVEPFPTLKRIVPIVVAGIVLVIMTVGILAFIVIWRRSVKPVPTYDMMQELVHQRDLEN
jgi:Cu-Zn family superoxide dismutase